MKKLFLIIGLLVFMSGTVAAQDTLSSTIVKQARLKLDYANDTTYRIIPPVYTYVIDVDKEYISGLYLERSAHNFTTSIILGIGGISFALVPVIFPSFNTDADAWYATGAGLGVASFVFYCNGIHLIHKSGSILQKSKDKTYRVEITGSSVKIKF